jgi:ribosome recycling factor
MDKFEIKKELSNISEFLKQELSKIRTGRATTSLVEDLEIEVYGAKMRIKELGSLTVPEAQLIVITPWDRSSIPLISKTINSSDLGLNSSFDESKVRVPVPPLSEERRNELAKIVNSKLENAKTSARSYRNEVNKGIDKDFSDKKISEDEKFSQKDEVDKIFKDFFTELERHAEEKRESILSI